MSTRWKFLTMAPVAVLSIAAVSASAQQTWRLSVDSAGTEGDHQSIDCTISPDGRFVAFYGFATNLVPGDTNGQGDVFVHDRRTGVVERVSVSSAGTQSDGGSIVGTMSRDGRLVSFHSFGTNLVPGDSNGVHDAFVHDRETGNTVRVSVDSAGAEGNDSSFGPTVSQDGRFVAFHGEASNLVPGDTNGVSDVFVHELATGVTTRVNVDSSGAQANARTFVAKLSQDGRIVVFSSEASNLVPGDANAVFDIFAHDRQTGITTRLSVDSSGLEGNGRSQNPRISDDGRHVAFNSRATNLVSGDTNGFADVFVHDRQLGVTTRVSVDAAGVQGDGDSEPSSISADGRYITYQSLATNLVPGDTNGQPDTFLHDRQTGSTRRISVDSAGQEGDRGSYRPWASADGRFVAFWSSATNLVPGDTNGWEDVFVHGPSLILEASAETVTTGAELALDVWGGHPGGHARIAAVGVNGSPLFLWVSPGLGTFDGDGEWGISGPVPPGLAGNEIRFLAFGFAFPGQLELTNVERVTFQ